MESPSGRESQRWHLNGLKDRLGLFNKEAKASLVRREPQAYLGFVVYLFSTKLKKKKKSILTKN